MGYLGEGQASSPRVFTETTVRKSSIQKAIKKMSFLCRFVEWMASSWSTYCMPSNCARCYKDYNPADGKDFKIKLKNTTKSNVKKKRNKSWDPEFLSKSKVHDRFQKSGKSIFKLEIWKWRFQDPLYICSTLLI